MCCNKGFQTVGAEGGEEETAEDVNQIIEILKYFKPLEQQNVFNSHILESLLSDLKTQTWYTHAEKCDEHLLYLIVSL